MHQWKQSKVKKKKQQQVFHTVMFTVRSFSSEVAPHKHCALHSPLVEEEDNYNTENKKTQPAYVKFQLILWRDIYTACLWLSDAAKSSQHECFLFKHPAETRPLCEINK